MSEEMKDTNQLQAEAALREEPEAVQTEAPAKIYPCIPLRGVSIFPNTVVHFDRCV